MENSCAVYDDISVTMRVFYEETKFLFTLVHEIKYLKKWRSPEKGISDCHN